MEQIIVSAGPGRPDPNGRSTTHVECRLDCGGGGCSFNLPGEFLSFTEKTVTVKEGNTAKTYDTRQHIVSSHYL